MRAEFGHVHVFTFCKVFTPCFAFEVYISTNGSDRHFPH
jgi:hypothetical protein